MSKWTRQEIETAITKAMDDYGWNRELAEFHASLETTCMNTKDFFNCDNCSFECRHNTKPKLGNGTKSKHFLKYGGKEVG